MFKAYSATKEENIQSVESEQEILSSFPDLDLDGRLKLPEQSRNNPVSLERHENTNVLQHSKFHHPIIKNKSTSRNPFARKFLLSKNASSNRNNLLAVSEAAKISKKRLKPENHKQVKTKDSLNIRRKFDEEKELFQELKSGDRSNIGLSCMYFADVPIYNQPFKNRCLIGKSKRFSKDSTKVNFVRYYHSKLLKQSSNAINFALKSQDIAIDKPLDYSKEIDQKTPEIHNYSSELTRKLQELNMAITHNSKDLKSWLALCDIQSEIEVQFSQRELKLSRLNESALNQQNIAEREIAVIEKALKSLPGNRELALKRLSLLHYITANVDEIKQEWKTFLIANPNNLKAWNQFFHFLIFNSKSDVDNVLASFYTCFRYLIGMKIGTFVSHGLNAESSEDVLLIFLKLLYFLLDSGHSERCLCLIQSLVEFNLSQFDEKSDRSLEDNDLYNSKVESFQLYFNSAVPKFGETNYISWPEFQTSQINDKTSAKSEEDLPDIEKFLKPDMPVWKNWLALERFRTVNNVYPYRLQKVEFSSEGGNDFTDCEDPERVVGFDFVKKFLYPFSETEKPFFLEQIYLFLVTVSQKHNLPFCLGEAKYRMNEHLFKEHLSHIRFEFDYAPNLSKILTSIEELAFKMATTSSNFLEFYFFVAKMKAKHNANIRAALKKELKNLLQISGNSNNLKIWKCLLFIEAICGNFQVIKKTVLSLSKMIEPKTVAENDVITEFKLDCAIFSFGLCDFDLRYDLDLFSWIFSSLDRLNKFRKPDSFTFKFSLAQNLSTAIESKNGTGFEIRNLADLCSQLEHEKTKNECAGYLSTAIYRLFKLSVLNLKTANEFLKYFIEKITSFSAFNCLCLLNCTQFTISKVRRCIDDKIMKANNNSAEKIYLFCVAYQCEEMISSKIGSNIFRVKSLLGRTLRFFPNSSFVWNKLLDIALHHSKNQQEVHDIFQTAVNNLPMNKDLFMSFVPFFPEQLERCLKTMIERKIRVRSPIEEVELFLNEIC